MKVIVIGGSDSDLEHMCHIEEEITKYSIPCVVRVCSAHKDPLRLMEILAVEESHNHVVWVSVAGLTDALSGTISFHSRHPVISCPPDRGNHSCLGNPNGSANATIFRPKNVAKFIAQMNSHIPSCRKLLQEEQENVVNKQRAKDASYSRA